MKLPACLRETPKITTAVAAFLRERTGPACLDSDQGQRPRGMCPDGETEQNAGSLRGARLRQSVLETLQEDVRGSESADAGPHLARNSLLCLLCFRGPHYSKHPSLLTPQAVSGSQALQVLLPVLTNFVPSLCDCFRVVPSPHIHMYQDSFQDRGVLLT